MEDFEKEDFEALSPYVTVYTENAFVNVNTAKPLVLKALLDSLSADHGAKQILLGRLEEACSLDKDKISKESLISGEYGQEVASTRIPSKPLNDQGVPKKDTSHQPLNSNLRESRVQGCFFLSRELQPETFAEKLKLPRTSALLSLVQQFLTSVTTDSETFRISMKANQREATGVFRYRVGQARPRVLGWHEE